MGLTRFLDYELDLSTGELRRAGAVVPLERQPAVALVLLVSRAGRLVPREDLRRALWPGDVHVDFDLGLNYCVRQLRAALGDDARAPRFIETVPRQGYRFVALLALSRRGGPLQPPVPVRAPRFQPRGRRLAAAAAAAALTLGLVWDSQTGGAERSRRHHAAAVKVLRAVHDVVF